MKCDRCSAVLDQNPSTNKKSRAPLVPPPGWTELGKLVAVRVKQGFSRGDVAAAMGVNYSYISVMERGSSRISPLFLERYASALDILIAASDATATP